MNCFILLQLKINETFWKYFKHEVFWDLNHKQCMNHVVNDNLLRYLNADRVCFDYKRRYLNNKIISLNLISRWYKISTIAAKKKKSP